MQTAVNNFQKSIFTLLLYVSAFSGIFTDFFMGGSRTMFYLIYDIMIIFLAVLSLGSMRSGLTWITIFILICIAFNFSYNEVPFMASLNGIREILILPCIAIFYNKVFAEGNEELTEQYVRIFIRYAVIFLLAQLPAAFYQFMTYGPTDEVGGTLGSMNSGVLTLTVICLVFFLSRHTWNITQTVMLYACLIPLLLNETKISFILIPLVMLFIHFEPKFKNILLAVVAAAVFLFLFNKFFTHGSLDFGGNNLAGIFSSDFLDDYLFGDIYFSYDVPRFTKIVVAWRLLAEQTHTLLFGFEYGVFKGGALVERTPFARTYDWLLFGTRPYLFFLLVQGGTMLVTGLLWLMAYINKFFTRDNNKFKAFLFMMFVLVLFYDDAPRNQHFVVSYFFMVFYANSYLYDKKFI